MFYDGSDKIRTDSKEVSDQKPIEVTAEMRKHLCGNPYILDLKK